MDEFRTKIAGKWWRVVLADGLYENYGMYGDCDPPDKRGKAIRIDPAQSDEEMLDTLVHELSHAICHLFREDVIAQISGDYCRAILQMFEVHRRGTADGCCCMDGQRDQAADGSGDPGEKLEGNIGGAVTL
jgi:hypothetical protein